MSSNATQRWQQEENAAGTAFVLFMSRQAACNVAAFSAAVNLCPQAAQVRSAHVQREKQTGELTGRGSGMRAGGGARQSAQAVKANAWFLGVPPPRDAACER